ncbi:MAG: hypothetical protein IJE46_04000 [Clostridia bacterium]|nr:hypothetical protein [Clostridia bacterium]
MNIYGVIRYLNRKNLVKALHSVGQNFRIGSNFIVTGRNNITLGDNVYIGPNAVIYSTGAKLEIGNHY